MMTDTLENEAPAAPKCAADQVPQQATRNIGPPQLRNIMVAVDFSDYSREAVRYGTFLAERFGAKVTLVHAVEPYVYPEDLSAAFTLEEIDARWMQKQKAKLEALQQTINTRVLTNVVVTMGTAWNRIVGAAQSCAADMIVIGTHGRTGLKHALMGSTAERVVRHATCPVLVVHLPAQEPDATP